MKRVLSSIGRISLVAALVLNAATPSHASFKSLLKRVLGARASVTGASALTITAGALPSEAFFGKNVIIPVSVSNGGAPITTRGLKIEILYQNVSADGTPVGGVGSAPIQFKVDPKNDTQLFGTAVIPRDDLVTIKNGGNFLYFFRAEQAGGDTVLGKAGILRFPAGAGANIAQANPFGVKMISTMRAPVSAEGTTVFVPDMASADGMTSITFPAGALTGPGFLVIKQEDADAAVPGPKGIKPVVVYSLTLEGTRLAKSAMLTMTYPWDLDGKVSGSKADPLDLAPFWFDGFEWRLLSKPVIDITLHTVQARTTHFSTFALFASGPVASADLRPRERIITPNGDSQNDEAIFGSGVDEVQIFDVRGRRVRKLTGPGPVWNGRDDDGRTVESGVYLYQFTVAGERISGVIAVAK